MEQILSTSFVAHEIFKDLKNRDYDQFTLRPFNRFNPKNTIWWLVPSTEWPSYKHGKITLFKPENSEDIMAGLYFEKGLSENASIMSKPAYRTLDDWAWNILLRDIESEKLEKILSNVCNLTGEEIELIIQAIPVMDKESAERNFEIPGAINIIQFKYKGVDLEYVNESAKGEMIPFTGIRKFKDLLEIFEQDDMGWFWIDFYAVIKVDNSEWNRLKKIVPIIINSYEEIF